MRTCARCKQDKPLSDFWVVRKSDPDGPRQGRCKPCSRYHLRDYRALHPEYAAMHSRKFGIEHPGRQAENSLKWARRNPERVLIAKRAQARVKIAISQGRLVRPTSCSQCGCSGRFIEAAHVDYSKPLEVIWLCTPCHRRFDSNDPKALKFLASGHPKEAE